MSTLLEIALQNAAYGSFVHHTDSGTRVVTPEQVKAIFLRPVPKGQRVHKVNLRLSSEMVQYYLQAAHNAAAKQDKKLLEEEAYDLAVSFVAQDMEKIGLPMTGEPVESRNGGWACLVEQEIRQDTELLAAAEAFLAAAK